MKPHISLVLCLSLALSACGQSNSPKTTEKAASASANGFALVELFTSEGCSSCPPADKLVNEIAAKNEGKPVYFLNFHVDYWNYLGWTDPYSKKAFSERQSWYAQKFGKGSYTPQMVVNGATEFVGSRRQQATDAIANAQTLAMPCTISLQKIGNKVHYTILGQHAGATLYYALVQYNQTSVIKAGENSGETLFHSSVVRQLNEIPNAEDSNDFEYNYKDTSGIVVWLQNPKTKEILSAAQVME